MENIHVVKNETYETIFYFDHDWLEYRIRIFKYGRSIYCVQVNHMHTYKYYNLDLVFEKLCETIGV